MHKVFLNPTVAQRNHSLSVCHSVPISIGFLFFFFVFQYCSHLFWDFLLKILAVSNSMKFFHQSSLATAYSWKYSLKAKNYLASNAFLHTIWLTTPRRLRAISPRACIAEQIGCHTTTIITQKQKRIVRPNWKTYACSSYTKTS